MEQQRKLKQEETAKKTGTDALKININPGTTGGGTTGGMNV